MGTIRGLVAWAKARAGNRWPVIVRAADGAATTFLLTFVGTFAAHGITTETVTTGSTWTAAGLAALVAALNVAKSGIMIAFTGQTALGAVVSNQLRAQRDTRPVKHPVPLRAAPATRKTPAAPYRGRHEATTPQHRTGTGA